MPLLLFGLIALSVTSLGAALYVYALERSRRAIIERASTAPRRAGGELAARQPSLVKNAARRLAAVVPESWTWNPKTEGALIQAGYDGETAPLMYGAVRVLLLATLPLLAFIWAPKHSFDELLIYVGGAAVIAIVLPMLWLVRTVRGRQDSIRRSLPDALDLIVVCIDAGISLDAAMLRVAKDLGTAHPELAGELLVANRKMNAGVTRGEALRGIWNRTGVEEVRALVSHIIQGERWGTSSGKILRVYASTLRRQRRQRAEKKAATAPVKMLIPLGFFIFPAILLVILGPVLLNIQTLFK